MVSTESEAPGGFIPKLAGISQITVSFDGLNGGAYGPPATRSIKALLDPKQDLAR